MSWCGLHTFGRGVNGFTYIVNGANVQATLGMGVAHSQSTVLSLPVGAFLQRSCVLLLCQRLTVNSPIATEAEFILQIDDT